MKKYDYHSMALFVLGLTGLVFYAIGPLLFPTTLNLRQPELLPIYSLMIGLGRLFKSDKDNGDKSNSKKGNSVDKKDE